MSQSLKIWREASAKIDFSSMNSMVREQASIFRRLGELNEFLPPSRELIAQISRAIGIVDWGAISRGLAKALPPNWGRLSDLPSWEKLPEVAFDDGIPIAWVPRQQLMEELLLAGGRGDGHDDFGVGLSALSAA